MTPFPDNLVLDRFDVELLNLLQEDAQRTAEALADRVDLSAPTVRRRLRRLRHAGIIERQVAVLHPKFRAERVSALVLVKLAAGTKADQAACLCRDLATAREVTYCGRGSGRFGLVVQLLVRAPEMVDAFVERELSGLGPVKDVTTVILADEAKYTSKVRLDRADRHHWMM